MQNRERERVEYGLIDTAACASTKIVMGAAEDSPPQMIQHVILLISEMHRVGYALTHRTNARLM